LTAVTPIPVGNQIVFAHASTAYWSQNSFEGGTPCSLHDGVVYWAPTWRMWRRRDEWMKCA
jgi:hypothetical protein